MRADDFDDFAQLLDDAYDLIGSGSNKAISGGAKSLFFAAMASYSLAQFRAALSAHCLDRARGRFTPKPADIIEQIEASALNDGRPGAEEAWAIALTSRDEADTVVWTAECAAAFSVCGPVLGLGDEVGARMAFKDAYGRLVAAARADRRPAAWSVSAGWDTLRRNAALLRAVTAGLLPAPVAPLLAAPEGQGADDRAREQLAEIKRRLVEGAEAKQRAIDAASDSRIQSEADITRGIAGQVEAYCKGEST
jgi:hypothetical protein